MLSNLNRDNIPGEDPMTESITVFIDIPCKQGATKQSPIDAVLRHVLKTLGVCVVDTLTSSDEREADIVITDDPTRALQSLKDTEHSFLVVVYLPTKQDEHIQAGARSLAEQYPGRVKPVSYVGTAKGEVDFIPYLIQIVAERQKEKNDADHAGG